MEYENKDSEDDVDEETENEIEEIEESNHGARMRLLQLLRGIKIRILWGEAVVEHLEEKGVSADVISDANAILAELSVLAVEADELIDNPTTKEDMIEKFLHIKREAKSLVKQFRELVRPYLEGNEKGKLRVRFNEINRNQLGDLHRQILERRRALNAEKAGKILDDMEIDDEEKAKLIEKIENGEIEADEIKTELRQKYRSLDEEIKLRVRSRLDEKSEDLRTELRARIDSYKENFEQKARLRVKQRTDILSDTAALIVGGVA